MAFFRTMAARGNLDDLDVVHDWFAQNEFQAGMRESTVKFATDDRVQAMPDYSLFPGEILQMIMRDVARLSQTEKELKRTISHHLLKCRLISKTICMAATTVFTSLARQTIHADYQVLHLPPKSGNLATLHKALTGPRTMYGNLITSIVYHVSTGQERDVDEEQAFKYFCNCDYGGEDDDDEDSYLDSGMEEQSCCRATRRVPMNISTYKKQCVRQDNFATHIYKNNKLLQTLLTSLPALARLEVTVKDFWEEVPGLFLSSAEENMTPARKAYHIVIPMLLASLSASPATKLRLDGFGSYAFGALSPISISRLNKRKTFLHNITDLELDLSHKDELFMEEDSGEMRFAHVQRSDRVSFLLHQLKKLRNPSLSCKEACAVEEDVEKDHIADRWLRDVLERQRWPSLHSFSLQGFTYSYDNKELCFFLCRHKSTSRNLVIRDINFVGHADHDPLIDLVKVMRGKLTLSTATIMINKELDLEPALAMMLDDNDACCESLVSPLLKVDIGALVLQPQTVEVVEVE